jgi:hypothetical protein
MQCTITTLPAFEPNIQTSDYNSHGWLIAQVHDKLVAVLSSWKWDDVFPQLLDHMTLVPKHFVSGFYLLCALLPGYCTGSFLVNHNDICSTYRKATLDSADCEFSR